MIRFLLNIALIPVNLIGLALILPAFIFVLVVLLPLQSIGVISEGTYRADFSWLKA